jgi:hypothetical protein
MTKPRWTRPFLAWLGICSLIAVALVALGFVADEFARGGAPAVEEGDGTWYTEALKEDLKKPRIRRQELNGILIGRDVPAAPIERCDDDADGASPVPAELVDARSAGTPVEVSPSYLSEAVSLELAEAHECSGTVVVVVKNYGVESVMDPTTQEVLRPGGGFFIARTLTSEPRYPVLGAAERLRAVTIAGHPAVLVEGHGLPQHDFMWLAESLYGG